MFITAFSTPTTIGMHFTLGTIALGDVITCSSVNKRSGFCTEGPVNSSVIKPNAFST